MKFRVRMVREAEWLRLLEIIGSDDSKIHRKNGLLWYEDNEGEIAFLSGPGSNKTMRLPGDKTAAVSQMRFRPAFVPLYLDAADEGTEIVASTLFMDNNPVLVDYQSLFEDDFVTSFIPGSVLEFRDPISDPCCQIRAIKVGNVYVATRDVLCNISWEEINAQFCEDPIKTIQASMVDLAHWQNLRSIFHDELDPDGVSELYWEKMHFWLGDEEGLHCGCLEPEYLGESASDLKSEMVGFRPMFSNHLATKPGEKAFIATLFLDGAPIKNPQNPAHDGDIPEYRAGARIEFRAPLLDPEYQITAIAVGDKLIADRCVLRNISWDDLASQGF